jgi:hypothetical protein
MAAYLSVLAITATPRLLADEPTMNTKPDKTITGRVLAVDSQARTLKVEPWWIVTRSFNLGTACSFSLLDNPSAAINVLHRGQMVKVRYKNASGVLVADRVEQQPLRHTGTVKTIDSAKHTVVVHVRGMDKSFQIADDCKVVLRNDKSGTLADIQPGHCVTVTYELPDNNATAHQIAQTSDTFTGTLTAIDLNDRTIKAKSTFGSRQFHLGDDCKIVLNGKTDGEMRNLKPGDKLTFSYDDVNGINVANRIAYAEPITEAMTATSDR